VLKIIPRPGKISSLGMAQNRLAEGVSTTASLKEIVVLKYLNIMRADYRFLVVSRNSCDCDVISLLAWKTPMRTTASPSLSRLSALSMAV